MCDTRDIENREDGQDEFAAHHRVNSYGEPARIEIVPDDKYAPLRANANDFIFVDADILDRDGNPVYNCGAQVEFMVSGGFIVGPDAPVAVAGKATIMLKATADVIVTARCGTITATTVIRTVK